MELSKIAWNYFKNSGNIEFYMLYNEIKPQGEVKQEKNTEKTPTKSDG